MTDAEAIPAFQITDPDFVLESKVVDEALSSGSVEFLPPPKPRNPVLDLVLPPKSSSPTAVEHQPDSNQIHILETFQDNSHVEAGDESHQSQPHSASPPYTIPPWSNPPCHPFHLEVLKDGSIVDQYNVSEKGAYMFGRLHLCDFVLEHPTISRFHAVLQFKRNGQAYLYDLGSTHGTFVNKSQVKMKVYVELHVGALIRFGQSSRLYIFQGPEELMPPEVNLENIRNTKVRQEIQDREASLLRAKEESSIAAGISWGMGEDAVEEIEDDIDEVTWQTFKGQLTEKQEKTREKVLKRYEKIGHMKKEIGAIRAKDITQGGLTQGQQTQIARNEQRIAQIAEELENLEETLNESILESLGARSGKVPRGKKVEMEEGDDFSSDDDEFYDRTVKRQQPKKNAVEIETADSLLDKKETIIQEMEAKKKLLLVVTTESQAQEAQTEDELDAFMSGLSSVLVLDKSTRVQNEISCLQAELDRILFLLNVADPGGEAFKKRNLKPEPEVAIKSEFETPFASIQDSSKDSIRSKSARSDQNQISKDSITRPKFKEPKQPSPKTLNQPPSTPSKTRNHSLSPPPKTLSLPPKTLNEPLVNDLSGNGNCKYSASTAQWLGAIDNSEEHENQGEGEMREELQLKDDFVDYKDRKKMLGDGDTFIADAAPGLIIRKRKFVAEKEEDESAVSIAEDAVALLLKHTGGLHKYDGFEDSCMNIPKRPMKVGNHLDSESWVPPEGQSGDGKTSLNERYGY